jgi:MFS family permease
MQQELLGMRDIPFSVWRLTLAYSLMMSGTSMVVLIAGIIGVAIAPTAGLATLPIALAVVGLASSTLPTGKLLGRFGRRKVFISYAVLAIGSAFIASGSLAHASFTGFSIASFLMGWSSSAGHQYRFAALEAVPAEQAPKATSALLLGGLLGAFVGPELAVRGHWLLKTEFAGSFLLLAGAYTVGLFIICFYRDSKHHASSQAGGGRPIFTILRSPAVLLAISASGIAYGVMSLIMSATPISMTQHSHHSLEATKVVIQSHIAGMFLPSLAYSFLFDRLGFRGMLWSGLLIFFACLAVALVNTDFMHYWLALVLLGVGWNFLYLTGTNLLVYGYQPEERFRVQSTNDFLVFTIQALVSFSSGWLLYQWQWHGLQWACLPLLLIFMVHLARTDFGTLTGIKSLSR